MCNRLHYTNYPVLPTSPKFRAGSNQLQIELIYFKADSGESALKFSPKKELVLELNFGADSSFSWSHGLLFTVDCSGSSALLFVFGVCVYIYMNVAHARTTAMTKYGVAAEIMCVCVCVCVCLCARACLGGPLVRVPLTVWTRVWCGKVGWRLRFVLFCFSKAIRQGLVSPIKFLLGPFFSGSNLPNPWRLAFLSSSRPIPKHCADHQ